MLNINEDEIKAAIIERAADEFLKNDHDLSGLIAKEVKARIDNIFVDRANAQIQAALDEAIKDGFGREYQRIDQWGQAQGKKTSIKAELEKLVSVYWSENVDARTGKPSDSSYSAVTRANYLMTQICAQDFTEGMKAHAQNVSGALKDGLRNRLAASMDGMLDDLFRIKSLQDQGKVEKPY